MKSFVRFVLMFCALDLAGASYAKETSQIILWPDSGATIVRFSLGKLKEIASVGNRHSYIIDTTAENLWGKVIPSASFSLYLFDKNKVRIGEGYISLNNVGVGE